MFQFTPEQCAVLDRFDAEVRFASKAETWKDNPIAGGDPIVDREKPGMVVYCEVFDKSVSTDKPYVTGFGTDRQTALADAVKKIPTAAKPLTPAQAASANAEQARIEALEKQVRELGAEPVAPPPAPEPAPVVVPTPEPSITKRKMNTGSFGRRKQQLPHGS